jgi:DNA-binding transcriptional LysR family regulator
MDIELRHLRMFVTVATELHFGRAAQVLHVSQPAVSQQVRALEKSLGVELFARTSRLVELTPAGMVLLDAAPRVLFEADRATDRVRQAGAGAVGLLVVGSVGTALASIAPLVLRELRTRFPDLQIEISQMDTAAQLSALAAGRIDVGLVRSAATGPSISTERLVEDRLVVALPEDHRLAADEAIDVADLAGDPFVLWPRALGEEFFDIVTGFCREHGFSPRVVAEGNDIETQLGLVAAGMGVSLQPAFYANLRRVGVAFRPLSGASPLVALQVAWRAGNSSPSVAHFVSAARHVASGAGTVGGVSEHGAPERR